MLVKWTSTPNSLSQLLRRTCGSKRFDRKHTPATCHGPSFVCLCLRGCECIRSSNDTMHLNDNHKLDKEKYFFFQHSPITSLSLMILCLISRRVGSTKFG